MPNDVSYFKLIDDETQYAFDDADGEARIAQNTADINDLTDDSGWIDLSPIFYRKVGGIVYVSCYATYAGTLTGGAWTTIATLPDGFRPSRRVDTSAVLGQNANVPGTVRIQSSAYGGTVQVYASSTISSGTYVTFSISYPV